MWPLIIFNVVYMLAAIAAAIAKGNSEFIFYIGVMIVLMAAVLVTHRRVQFSKTVLWGLSIWGLLHMAGGLVPVPQGWPINGDKRVLYSLWFIPGYLKYDNIVHAFGFGVTTLLCWEGLRVAIAKRANLSDRRDVRPTWGVMVLCAAGAMGFGALNEVVEFIATLIMPSTNVGGYVNTGWDLVSNMVGATAVAIAVRLWKRSKIQEPQSDK